MGAFHYKVTGNKTIINPNEQERLTRHQIQGMINFLNQILEKEDIGILESGEIWIYTKAKENNMNDSDIVEPKEIDFTKQRIHLQQYLHDNLHVCLYKTNIIHLLTLIEKAYPDYFHMCFTTYSNEPIKLLFILLTYMNSDNETYKDDNYTLYMYIENNKIFGIRIKRIKEISFNNFSSVNNFDEYIKYILSDEVHDHMFNDKYIGIVTDSEDNFIYLYPKF